MIVDRVANTWPEHVYSLDYNHMQRVIKYTGTSWLPAECGDMNKLMKMYIYKVSRILNLGRFCTSWLPALHKDQTKLSLFYFEYFIGYKWKYSN